MATRPLRHGTAVDRCCSIFIEAPFLQQAQGTLQATTVPGQSVNASRDRRMSGYPRGRLRNRDRLDSHGFLRLAVTGAVGVVRALRGDRLQDVQALGDRAERRVVRAERGVLVDQEELAAVG